MGKHKRIAKKLLPFIKQLPTEPNNPLEWQYIPSQHVPCSVKGGYGCGPHFSPSILHLSKTQNCIINILTH